MLSKVVDSDTEINDDGGDKGDVDHQFWNTIYTNGSLVLQ